MENIDKNMTRAAINKRFTRRTYVFLLRVYLHFFKIVNDSKCNININLLNKFKAVNIIDSSSWKIPKALKRVLPGYNDAGCKIQMMLDYKTGITRLLNILKENCNDQGYSKRMKKQIRPDDLFLFDLGYSIPTFLKMITEQMAFFVSRFSYYATNLYVKKENGFHKVDILDVLKNLKYKRTITEFEYYVGNKNIKTQVRFFAVKLPEKVINEKRRKTRKKFKREGKVPSAKILELCAWNLLMTNIPAEKGITVKEILSFYPIRWTIELFFKQLKSGLAIHKTEVKKNVYRLKCELLGKCIVMAFISFCYSVSRARAWQILGKEISFEKTVKFFKRHATFLYLAIANTKRLLKFVENAINKIICNCQKNRQNSRNNSLDGLIGQLNYKNYKYVNANNSNLVRTACLS